jgi:hypothetical protein
MGLLFGAAFLAMAIIMLVFTVCFFVYCLLQGGATTIAMLFLLLFCLWCGRWVARTWKSI